MAQLKTLTHRFMQDESGQNLIEYALIACLIGLAAITSLSTVANSITGAFCYISSKLNAAA